MAQGVPETMWNAWNALIDPDGRGPRLLFQRVPELKPGKNRLHLDVYLSGDKDASAEQRRASIQAAAERLRGLGATIGPALEEHGVYWIVMQDPEGNEFCVH